MRERLCCCVTGKLVTVLLCVLTCFTFIQTCLKNLSSFNMILETESHSLVIKDSIFTLSLIGPLHPAYSIGTSIRGPLFLVGLLVADEKQQDQETYVAVVSN